MTEVKELRPYHLARFEELERYGSENGSTWLSPLRRQALAEFERQGFPTTRQEEWKYFDVAPIKKQDFRHILPGPRPDITERHIQFLRIDRLVGPLLVFVDGIFQPALSSTQLGGNGVEILSLAEGLRSRRDLVEPHLGRYARADQNPFVALNTAFLQDGALIHVPAGRTVEDPIHLLYVATGAEQPTASHPRNLILLGESTQLNLVEDYVGLGRDLYFRNPVTEIVIGENAVLDLYKMERESLEALHVAATAVSQQRNSTFRSHSLSVGGLRVRNDLSSIMDGEGCDCTLNGLTIATGGQLVDDHTNVVHAKAYCTSNELYKSILDGSAQGVFNGKILVAKDAQKTDAHQTNKNLLLSKKALMNTKPQLEIFADDVKATHGATIGQIDPEAMFYLRSRGIDQESAESMLAFAFAEDVVSRFRLEPLRSAVECMLFLSFPRGMETEIIEC